MGNESCFFRDAVNKIKEYFSGKRRNFDLRITDKFRGYGFSEAYVARANRNWGRGKRGGTRVIYLAPPHIEWVIAWGWGKGFNDTHPPG